jgi:hypothetical protein
MARLESIPRPSNGRIPVTQGCGVKRCETRGREAAVGRIGYPIGAALGTLISVLVGPAGAQEYCVACSEPNAVYRCVIEGAKQAAASRCRCSAHHLAREAGTQPAA